MKTISVDSPAAIALREWLVDNCRIAALYGCDDRLLRLYLIDADEGQGQIEIRSHGSVTGQTVTYEVQYGLNRRRKAVAVKTKNYVRHLTEETEE
jgi:hypothetical protein